MNEGGQAFPRPAHISEFGIVDYDGVEGMSLRKWYAGLAMQAWTPLIVKSLDGAPMLASEELFTAVLREIRDVAFAQADMMIGDDETEL